MNKKYQVTIRTSDFRGDHATDLEVAIDVSPDTTIQELVNRIFNQPIIGLAIDNRKDWLVIRPIATFEEETL